MKDHVSRETFFISQLISLLIGIEILYVLKSQRQVRLHAYRA